jgi:hypothetical protein
MNTTTPNTEAYVNYQTSANPIPTHMVFPPPLSENRITLLISKGIDKEIAQIDLEMVKMKLRDKEEGEGWSVDETETNEIEYKRWLTLVKKYGKGMVPTKEIDIFWHQHILDTHAYLADCQKNFGGYLHHYPYFGMRGEQDAKDLENSFYRTKKLYEESFNETIGANSGESCHHNCVSRCWHACKN